MRWMLTLDSLLVVPDLTSWFRKMELLLTEMVTKTIKKKNSAYL